MKKVLARLFIVFCLFAVALTANLAWYRIVNGVSGRVVLLEEQIEEKTETQKRIQAMRSALERIENDEASLDAYFVSSDTIVAFLEDLQRAGAASGAEVSVLSVSAASTGGDSVLKINISVTGAFAGVMGTIGSIEHAPYLITADTLSLNAASKDDAAAATEWRANMQITVGSVLTAAEAAASSTNAGTKPTPHPAGSLPKPSL